MARAKDLTGKRFYRLLVIRRSKENKGSHAAWDCKCDCGNEVSIRASHLPLIKSCGCYRSEWSSKKGQKDIKNQRFGELLALEKIDERSKRGGIVWKCKCDCGREVNVPTHELLRGHRKTCKICKLLINKRPDLIKEWDFSKNKISVDKISFASKKKVWWICNKCNHSWEAQVDSRTSSNTNCPICRESHGEKTTNEIFKKYNINTERGKKFNNCKYKQSLSFDFYLPDYNLCIEFQGMQHYKEVEYWDKKDNLKNRRIRDQIKRDFCKSEGIRLLEIPYWEIKNIEAILVKELNLLPTPPE